MEKVVFREVTFSFPIPDAIELSFTSQAKPSKILDWSQVFFFTKSIITIKVFQNNLHISQFFLCSETSDFFQSKSENCGTLIKLSLPDKVLPSLNCVFFDERFQILVPVCPNKLYVFTLDEDLGLNPSIKFEKSQIYEIDSQIISSFSFIRSFQEEFEVSCGLNNGQILIATFKAGISSEPIPASNVKLIDPPTSLITKFKNLMIRPIPQDKAIRICSLCEYLILTLTNFGIIRVYDLISHKYVSELDLELPEIFEHKFVTFTHSSGFYIGLGYYKDDKSWIYLIQVLNSNLVLLSQFTENGILHDIGINHEGLWIAFGSFHFSNIILKPFENTSSVVYSYFDEIQRQDNIDLSIMKSCSSDEILKRIFNSGRFQESWILDTFRKITKIKNLEWKDIKNAEIPKKDLIDILNELKFLDSQSKEVWALGVCDKVGEYPVMVIRGNDKIGIIRKSEDKIENCDIGIRKLASGLNSFGQVDSKNFVFCRLGFDIAGVDLVLLLVRIWRKPLSFYEFKDFTQYLKQVVKNPFPYFLIEKIKKTVPSALGELLLDDLEVFMKMFNEKIERNQVQVNGTWSRFALRFLSASLGSFIESVLEYFTDVCVLLTLLSENHISVPELEINSSLKSDFLNIGSFLHSLHSLTSSQLYEHKNEIYKNQALKNLLIDLQVFNFPSTVSSLYVHSRSYLLLGNSESFDIINYSSWMNHSLKLAMSDLITFIDESGNSRIISGKLQNFYPDFRIFPVNLINLLSIFGLQSVLSSFFESFDDPLRFFYLARSKINLENPKDSQKLLIKSLCTFTSGSEDFNYHQLEYCPITLASTSLLNSSLSSYSSALLQLLPGQSKSSLFLSELILGSFNGEFGQDSLEFIIKSLSKVGSFTHAYTLLQFTQNKKSYKSILCKLIEDAVKTNKFYEIINLNFDSNNKEIIKKFMWKKEIKCKIDLFTILTRNAYRDKTVSLFNDTFTIEDREVEENESFKWVVGFYCFAMKNLYYSEAAAVAFKTFIQIERVLMALDRKLFLEKKFLVEVMEEFWMMSKLAARNIDKDLDKCWFLVYGLEKNEEKRTLVNFDVLKKLENKYFTEDRV